ncbi:hypothetical protein D3C81_1723460 [compost metagenome]
MHGIDEFQVRRRFVDKALAQAVDHDGAGERTLGEDPPGLVFTRHGNGRCPPGPIHQRGGRALGHASFQGCAGVVAGRRRAPGLAGRLGQVLVAQDLILFKASGGQDHPQACMQLHLGAVTPHGDSGDPTVIGDQAAEIGVEPQRHVAVHQRAAQRGHQ